jgi:hypothetical protein
MPVTLEVFANTGHQYFTIPLTELVPKALAQKISNSQLELLAGRNRGPFTPLCREVPWVRYQFDVVDAKPVLKLAIETNLGLNTRGFQYDEEEVDEKPEEEFEVAQFAGRDERDLEAACDRQIPVTSIPTRDGQEFPVDLVIYFVPAGGQNWIDVDLIVDLGNTRTAAILLESPGPLALPLDQRIYPLRILPRGTQFELAASKPVSATDLPSMLDECAIIESWLLLHQSIFAHLEPPSEDAQPHARFEQFKAAASGRIRYRKRSYLPQAFVEMSPALIGGGKSEEGASRILADATLETDAPFFLSSPKRYVFDDRPQGQGGNTFWFEIPNQYSKEFRQGQKLLPLSGLLRYFMEPGGHDWSLDQSSGGRDFSQIPYFKANPIYPRRAAVCWYALSLLEAAYRQINAPGYRKATGRTTLPRRLRWIRVTFPTGWTSEEKKLYFNEWKRAINLFTLTHLEGAGAQNIQSPAGPVLAEQLMDEAVCSQLPIIYAQVQTLMNDGQTWIDLYGNGSSLVVMNLDIGGGTTDMSIIQYQNKANGSGDVSLSCKLLFRFGNAIAGDMVVKAVIERVLLPAWIRASDRGQYSKNPRACLALENLFTNPAYNIIRQVDPFMPRKLARITRLVLAPLANRLLQKMGELDEETTANWEPLDIEACVGARLIPKQTLDDFNDLCIRTIRHYCNLGPDETVPPPFSEQAKVVCKPEQINQCIKDVFSGMFNNLGLLAARFKCHLVIVSGKPSELPLVRKLLDASFPLVPQRIMTVKNFPAGRWYPFATPDGKIQDAKTCTVVGAALFQELVNGQLRNFGLASADATEFFKQYYWGIIPGGGKGGDFYRKPHLLFSPADYHNAVQQSADRLEVLKTFTGMPLDCRIGRQIARLKDVPPDPVYELAWELGPSTPRPTAQVTAAVTLKWVSVKGEGEHLELVNVTPEDAPQVNPQDIKLKLNTLLSRDFWMDLPEFDTRSLFAHLAPKQPR